MHPAVKELFKIVALDEELEREASLFSWKNKWLVNETATQLLSNMSTMNLNELDFTHEYLASDCAKKLIERNAVKFSGENTWMKAEMWCLRWPYEIAENDDGAA